MSVNADSRDNKRISLHRKKSIVHGKRQFISRLLNQSACCRRIPTPWVAKYRIKEIRAASRETLLRRQFPVVSATATSPKSPCVALWQPISHPASCGVWISDVEEIRDSFQALRHRHDSYRKAQRCRTNTFLKKKIFHLQNIPIPVIKRKNK